MKKFDNDKVRHAIWAVFIGVVITCAFSAYADRTEEALAENIIRLHVIANSDSDEDQNLKLAVRDAIVEEVGYLFADNRDKYTAKGEIEANIDRIENISREVISDSGFDYGVSVELGSAEFPTKAYGDVTFPAGSYDALKVVIGDGRGKNWWCVLFPPLCFVDGSTAEMPTGSHEILRTSMTDEQYAMVTDGGNLPVKVKFKAYEMWQSGMYTVRNMFASR